MNTSITVKQAARFADVHESEIYDAIARGLIKADSAGRRLFIDQASLETFAARRKQFREWRDASRNSEALVIGA